MENTIFKTANDIVIFMITNIISKSPELFSQYDFDTIKGIENVLSGILSELKAPTIRTTSNNAFCYCLVGRDGSAPKLATGSMERLYDSYVKDDSIFKKPLMSKTAFKKQLSKLANGIKLGQWQYFYIIDGSREIKTDGNRSEDLNVYCFMVFKLA